MKHLSEKKKEMAEKVHVRHAMWQGEPGTSPFENWSTHLLDLRKGKKKRAKEWNHNKRRYE